MKHFAIGPLLACPLLALAAAQTPVALDAMTVTGRGALPAERLGATVVVYQRDEISNSTATSLAEFLRGRAGIEVTDFYGDGSVVNIGMRGFGEAAASNTLILLDGQPLNNTDIGAPNLGRIALADVERVEILQGGTALWGNQAVGGVISIETAPSSQHQLQFLAGSHSERELRLQTGVQREAMALGLSARDSHRDNYRDNNSHRRRQAALDLGWSDARVQSRLRYQWTDESLHTPGALFGDELAQNRRQSAADFADDFSALETRSFDAQVGLQASPSWRLGIQAGLRDDDGDFRLSFRGFQTQPATQDRRLRHLRPQLNYTGRIANRPLSVAAGLDLHRSRYELVSQLGPQRNEQEQDDFWLTAAISPLQALTLQISARRSQLDDELDDGGAATAGGIARIEHRETTAGLRLQYRLNDRLAVYASADEVLRLPKVDEYFGTDMNFSPVVVALRPQTGENLELGLNYQAGDWRAQAQLWRLQLSDEIAFDPTTFSSTNLPDTTRDGANLILGYAPAGPWDLEASLAWQDARLDNDRAIPLTARRFGQLHLGYRASAHSRLSLSLRASAGRQPFGDFDGDQPALPGYAVVDLGASQRLAESLQLQLVVRNLLGKEYAEYGVEDFSGATAVYPLPERVLQATLTIDL